MADIAGPTILSAVRVQGKWVGIQYSAGASGYNRIYADIRTLTGAWRQATTSDSLTGSITITTIGGSDELDANTPYQVKLRARHTTNQPVAESNTVNVGAWEVQTPTLLSAERTSPGQILLTYEKATPAAGGKIYVERRTTPSGTWGQVTSFDPATSGTYPIAATASASYEVRIRAGQYGVYSAYSSARSVNAWETSAPNVTGATRTGAASAQITYTGAVAGASLVFQRRLDGSATWVTLAGVSTPSSSGTYTMQGLSGAASYDVRAYVVQSNVASAPSSERALAAWFSRPDGVSDLSEQRRSNGTVDLAWSGVSTTRAPYSGQRVYRAEGALGQFAVLPAGSIAGNLRSFYDATAKPEREYRYMVAPYNDAGESSSRPTVTSKASVLVPNAPSSTTAVYVSDTAADVSWPDPAATERPISRFIVRRWLLGAWTTVKTDVPGTVFSWRDTGLSKNGVYRYQVQSVNAAGSSAEFSPDSADVVTTPAGASSVTAVRSGLDVKVSWVAPANSIATSWDVDHTVDPNPATATEDKWFPMSTGTLSGAARSWVHEAAAGGVPHTYRVRPTRTGAPTAPWVRSALVSPYGPPNAPTLVPPTVVDATGVIRLGWVHNPVDGTGQSSAVLEYRKAGGSWTTRNITGTASFYDVAAGTFANGDVVEWRVSTKGQSATASPVATGSFTARARPAVSVTYPTPGLVVSSGTVTVVWVTSSQASWSVRLLDGIGNVVDVRSGNDSSTRQATFSDLVDRRAYSVEVTVRDAYQSSLPTTVAFTVELDRPAPPLLTATPNPDDGTVLLTATAVQGLKLTRYSWAPPTSGWTTYGTGAPVVSAVVQVAGVERSALLLAPGQTYQSPPITVPAMLAGLTSSVLATAMSTSAPGEVRVDYIDAGGANTATGSGTATVAGVPVTVYGDLFESWPAGWRIAVTNTGTEPLYVWDAWGIARAGSDDASFFDGDTRRDGFTYGWNSDGTAYEAVPVSDPAEADFPVALTTRLEVIRVNPDGSESPLGDVGPDGYLTDRLPPLGVRYAYVARAWTTAPAYADSTPAWVRVDSRDVHVNFGTGWTGHVVGGARTFNGTGGGRETAPVVYAGHDFATNHQAETLDPRTGSITVQLLPAAGASTLAEWIAALGAKGNITYREPCGLIIEGAAQLSSWDPGTGFRQSVQFSIVETDTGEGNSTSVVAPVRVGPDASDVDFAAMFSAGIA